jgi:hypothetical protein
MWYSSLTSASESLRENLCDGLKKPSSLGGVLPLKSTGILGQRGLEAWKNEVGA